MISIIFNPVAGGRQNPRVFAELDRLVRERRIEADLVKTISPGDEHLATVAVKKGYDHIVVIGGDGSVNDVVNGIAGQGLKLGIVPTGRSNSIARTLGIPLDWQKSLAAALRGTEVDVPVARAGKRAFLGSVGFGAEAELPAGTAAWKGFRFEASPVAFRSFRPYDVLLEADGTFTLAASLLSGSIANLAHRFEDAVPAGLRPSLHLVLHAASGSATRLAANVFRVIEPSDVAISCDGEVQRVSTPFDVRRDGTQVILVAGAGVFAS